MKRSIERGFTLIEIMIVIAIIALLAAVAIPSLLRGRTSANEAAAIGNMRALISSLEMFRSVNNAYPLTANWITGMYPGGGSPAYGPPSFNHVMDLTACPPAAASSCVQGYRWNYVSAAGTVYTLEANPDAVNTTGTRSFFGDNTGQIRHCTCPAAGCVGAGTGATAVSVTIDATPNPACP